MHREIWPEILKLIKKAGVRNYSIYLRGNELFSYLEVDDWDKAVSIMMDDPLGSRFQEVLSPLMEADDPVAPWEIIEEVFHLD
jgi:L-rhamnose mutarotase